MIWPLEGPLRAPRTVRVRCTIRPARLTVDGIDGDRNQEDEDNCRMLDDIKKTLWATADKLRANMDVRGGIESQVTQCHLRNI